MPEPHPSSCGSISQGMPLRSTNTIPGKHARSAKRGLPPLGIAFEMGMKGSTSSHNLSGTSEAGIGQSSKFEHIPSAEPDLLREGSFVRGTKQLRVTKVVLPLFPSKSLRPIPECFKIHAQKVLSALIV